MHARLSLRLLGDAQITFDDQPVTAIVQQREQALLTWLIVHRDAPQPRSLIAFSLWPDSTEPQALTNLRKTLLLLRRHLPDADAFLRVERQSLQWRTESPVAVDVADFQDELIAAAVAGDPTTVRQHLEEAIERYGGELLPGCYDDWIIPLREQLHQKYMDALDRLVDLLEGQRDYAKALNYAERSLNGDPLHEGGYLRLMRLHALLGNRARALRVYHTCSTVLMREMGVEPNAEIEAAYARLLAADEGGEDRAGSNRAAPRAGTSRRLLGRRDEWNALRACWEELRDGAFHVVAVNGEAGIGKSRLAEELYNWAERQGILVARARAFAAEGELAYAPVSDWLRSPRLRPNLTRLGPAWLTEIARLMPELLDERPDLSHPQPFTEEWQRQRLYAALAHGLLVANQPLLLVLDDLQWCDRETLNWLNYLLRFTEHDGSRPYPQARLLLLCTYRDNETELDHPLHELLHTATTAQQLTEVALGPLNEAETRRLAEEVAGTALSNDQTERLHAETGGNPLFVVESVRAGSHRMTLSGQDGHGHAALPVNIYAMIQARLAQLSDSAREMAAVACVIGREFDFDLVAAASVKSEDEVVLGLEELWKRRIIQEEGSDAYDFSHARLRDVGYAELSRPRRRLLHRRVAKALQERNSRRLDVVAGQVAEHYEKAGIPDAAADRFVVAGERSLENWATAQAVREFGRAVELAPDDLRRAQGLFGLARARFLLNQRSEALGDVDLALSILADPDDSLRPQLLYLKADILVADSEPDAAEPAVRAALEAAEQIGDQETVCQSLSLLGVIHSNRGELTREAELIERALTLARDTGNRWREARTQVDLAFLHTQMGEFRQAISLATAALSYLKTSSDRGGVAFAWNILGRAHGGLGNFDDAFAAFEQGRQEAEEIDLESISLQIPNMLGWLHRQLGDHDRALKLDRRGVELAERAQLMLPEISARLNVCHDLLELEGPAALRLIEERMARGDFSYHGWRWRLRLYHIQGLCHLDLHEPAEVLDRVVTGAEIARHTSARKYLALYHELSGAALAQMGQQTQAIRELEQALRVADAINCRPIGWRISARLSKLYRRLGNLEGAEDALAEAEAMVVAIGENVSDASLRAAFLSSSAGMLRENDG